MLNALNMDPSLACGALFFLFSFFAIFLSFFFLSFFLQVSSIFPPTAGTSCEVPSNTPLITNVYLLSAIGFIKFVALFFEIKQFSLSHNVNAIQGGISRASPERWDYRAEVKTKNISHSISTMAFFIESWPMFHRVSK